jgi:uncharacterized protein DUF5677
MPTDPQTMILDRQRSRATAIPLLQVASATLQEIVNYSTQLIIRCSDASKSEIQKNEEVSIFLLYLHMLEITDAIEVLISESCPYPATPLLRSSFEALIGMDYILREDFTRRSLSWLVGTIHS